MVRNSAVTIYHQIEDGYERSFFPRVSLLRRNGIKATDSGQAWKNSLIVRIFTQDDLQAEPGDKLVIGYSESLLPPAEKVYTIVELADNRRGSGKMRHYKLTAA